MSAKSGEFQIGYRFFANNLEVFDSDGSVSRIKWGPVAPGAIGQIHGRAIELVHWNPYHYKVIVETGSEPTFVAEVKSKLFSRPEIRFISGDVYRWRRVSLKKSRWISESENATVEFVSEWFSLNCNAKVIGSIESDISGVLIAVGAYLRQIRILKTVVWVIFAAILAWTFLFLFSEINADHF